MYPYIFRAISKVAASSDNPIECAVPSSALLVLSFQRDEVAFVDQYT